MKPIQLIKQHLENEVKLLKKTIAKEKVVRDSSTSAMQSWSDTTRSQAESLIAALEKKLSDVESQISNIPKQDNVNKTDAVSTWNLIEIQAEDKLMKIIIVPEGIGGRIVKEIYIVSEKSPLGKKVLGKKEGQKITFDNKTFRLVKI